MSIIIVFYLLLYEKTDKKISKKYLKLQNMSLHFTPPFIINTTASCPLLGKLK